MTPKQIAAILRKTARAAEKEWASLGYPSHVGSSTSYLLCRGCCFVADRTCDAQQVVFDVATPEFGDDWYFAPPGTKWSARILWMYVMAHAVEEGRA